LRCWKAFAGSFADAPPRRSGWLGEGWPACGAGRVWVCVSLVGEERFRGGLDGCFEGLWELCEEGQEWAGGSDACEFDSGVKHGDGAVRVSQIFETFVAGADGFSRFEVARLHRAEHFLGRCWGHADASAGVGFYAELAPVDDGGLFADSADEEVGADGVNDAAEEGIFGGILADDGILDPRDDACIHEGFDDVRGDVAFIFHVEDCGDAGFFGPAEDGVTNAFGVGDGGGRKEHRGGEAAFLEDGGLIHGEAEVGAHARNNPCVSGSTCFELVEHFLIFGKRNVIEVCVSTVEEG